MAVPLLGKAERIARSFTASGRILFISLATVLVCSSLVLVYSLSRAFFVIVPAPGGTLTEGIIGVPRFINPLLAISDADRDLVQLTYSGLLHAEADGSFTPDLAESYTTSDDGREYTFVLKPGTTFQDGTPVTVDDVVYTVALAQDPNIKSPKRANWDGVVVEKVSDREVRFTLKSPFAPFIENATLGILPKHLWKEVSAEEFPFSSLNAEAVGSGPYTIAKVTRNASGIPQSYELKPFSGYALGKPYLSRLTLSFYESEDQLVHALLNGSIEAASGIASSNLQDVPQVDIRRAPLNRVFGVFFNQNQSEILRDPQVRAALNQAVNREEIVQKILSGYGTPIYEPLPPGISPVTAAALPTLGTATTTDQILTARAYLESKGWVWSESEKALTKKKDKKTTEVLAFTLSVPNVPDMRNTAELVRGYWEKMGARVDVKIFEQGDFNQNILRPRKYDAVLFGEIASRELDLFAFWHSSQRNDPGLNIALYANANADALLNDLRTTADQVKRQQLYVQLRAEIAKDTPAVFLYAPDFVYVLPQKFSGLAMHSVATPAERFVSVYQWHTEVDQVWSFLARFAGA